MTGIEIFLLKFKMKCFNDISNLRYYEDCEILLTRFMQIALLRTIEQSKKGEEGEL